MDIGSGKKYPCNALSNFAPHPFVVDGVQCNSMEGFLQSLKFKSPDMQKEVCKLVGRAAKFKGKDKKWWVKQTLYWDGKEIGRQSNDYQKLLDRAYAALAKNEKFKKAIKAAGNATFNHSIGKNDPKRTVLTVNEFTDRLYKIRDMYWRLSRKEKKRFKYRHYVRYRTFFFACCHYNIWHYKWMFNNSLHYDDMDDVTCINQKYPRKFKGNLTDLKKDIYSFKNRSHGKVQQRKRRT